MKVRKWFWSVVAGVPACLAAALQGQSRESVLQSCQLKPPNWTPADQAHSIRRETISKTSPDDARRDRIVTASIGATRPELDQARGFGSADALRDGRSECGLWLFTLERDVDQPGFTPLAVRHRRLSRRQPIVVLAVEVRRQAGGKRSAPRSASPDRFGKYLWPIAKTSGFNASAARKIWSRARISTLSRPRSGPRSGSRPRRTRIRRQR